MTSYSPLGESGPLLRQGLVIPAILCGGSGSRLWPVSRKNFAKQHVPIIGGASPFQRTIGRLSDEIFGAPIVISAEASRFLVAEEAKQAGVEVEIALEPEGRDTLAAVTLAACLAARRDPAAIVMIMPSDHLIPDAAAFAGAAAAAVRLAEEGRIVTLGIAPTGPSTAYGYIVPGEALAAGGNAVARFVEKPEAGLAAELIAGGCLWNAGIFCFRADAGLREIGALAPRALEAVRMALAEATDDVGMLRLGRAFAAAPRISFDRAVMEHTTRAAVLPAGFAWSDIGDWKAVWEHSPRDDAGVAREGKVHAREVTNSYLRSDGRLLCVLGVDGLAVVDTPDAVLVAPIGRAQEVRAVVADLEAQGAEEASTPARVHRPWGWYQTMDLGERFRVKRLVVAPGKKLSLQKHHHRAEHWVVVRGTAEVTRDSEVLLVHENESIYLPSGCAHRLANPGKIPVEIVEVQTGTYLGEDDIVRIEDDFGRR
ncbi:mannose-1-phosphate guanylyltransferase/mannose-6-phosphate isomerase [Amaricoccus sp.]|uniref:mannose-1-phosphate guanylyltransferase/mannose-6-phosphate isomerase n=1 Tax=Amaricoccus sp. TaxID=1872485 RepID=UPI00262B5EE5|nr:mannose-1-phosphate guanylyltransferase/mannose-6-phosphate isomerase [Amaricoccus sp.]HRO12741.1 mannose-1-phosphate guanylyltransferase/mannose-6-phosphate isomerase [Amaricoccus sp.]